MLKKSIIMMMVVVMMSVLMCGCGKSSDEKWDELLRNENTIDIVTESGATITIY